MKKNKTSNIEVVLYQIQMRFPMGIEDCKTSTQFAYKVVKIALPKLNHNSRVILYLFLKNHLEYARKSKQKALFIFCNYLINKLLNNTAFYLCVKDFVDVFELLNAPYAHYTD